MTYLTDYAGLGTWAALQGSILLIVILVAVGYVVDSATDTYVGDLAAIPGMLNWFIVIMGLVPCILGLLALLVFRKYPITPELAAEMRTKLNSGKAQQEQ